MLHEPHTGYPVLEDAELLGFVTFEDGEERTDDPDALVRPVMTTDLVTFPPNPDATGALRTLQCEDIARLFVTDESGALVGCFCVPT